MMLDFYRSILPLAGLYATDEGRISASAGGESIPIMVNGKRLVLPLQEHVSNPDRSSIELFHPLSENILTKKENAVLNKYRDALEISLNVRIGELIAEMLVLASSTALQKQLNPEQLELLMSLKDVDEKTLSAFDEVSRQARPGNKDRHYVHFYIKPNGKIDNRSYLRVCVVSSPFNEALSQAEDSLYGVKLRKKDVRMLKEVVKLVLPNLDNPQSYNRGSFTNNAPTLEALLLTVKGFATQINGLCDLFESTLPGLEKLRYNDEWVEPLENIDQFQNEIRMLPMQTSPEPITSTAPLQAQAPSSNVPVQQVQMPGVQVPVRPVQAVPLKPQSDVVYDASGQIDLHETMLRSMQNNMMQNPGMPMMQGVPMGYPNPMMGGFGMMQQAMSAPDALRASAVPAYELAGFGAQPVVMQPQYYNQGYNQPMMQQPGYSMPMGYSNVRV